MHPILFQIKYLTVSTLWIFIAAAIIISAFVLIKLSIRDNLKLQFLSSNLWKLILIALLGSRLLALILNYDIYFYELSGKTFLQIFYIWDKGLSLYGGIIAVGIYFYHLCKKEDQDFFKWLDILVPSFILATAITHIGAFFEGINYGTPTSLPWGVNFESPAIKYTVPIHPTQIYAFIYSMVSFAALIFINKINKIENLEKKGFIGILGIIFYSSFCFLEEFLRGDDTLIIFNIRIPQIISLAILISSGIFLYLRYNMHAKNLKSKKF